MDKFLIVDGHNLLFQMFYGMPSRITNKDGKAIQGTLGFVGALLKIIRMTEPSHLIVLFDGEHENDRTNLDPQYKANRSDDLRMSEENNPFSQLPDIYDALDFLGIKHIEASEFEADDVIASYSLSYGKDMKIIISSFDSDFFQLIDDNISVLRYRGDKTVLCDLEYIQNKYGIVPKQYVDFKSLTGDNADNIKGADKIGPKTASQLLCEFGTIDNIIENSEKIKKPSIQDSIMRNVERLKTNQKLIHLDNKAKPPFYIDELFYSYNGITTNHVLSGIGIK